MKRLNLTQRGVFRSDKYEWCKKGFLALKFTDPMAQDLIAEYAYRRQEIDLEFSEDVDTALRNAGYGVGELNERAGKMFRFLSGFYDRARRVLPGSY